MELSGDHFWCHTQEGWRQESQLGSRWSKSGVSESVISRAAAGTHPRNISKRNAVGLKDI